MNFYETCDLAKKIEWVGLNALSVDEKKVVRDRIGEVSRYLPRGITITLWKHFNLDMPNTIETREELKRPTYSK